jgi:hypothetical protein
MSLSERDKALIRAQSAALAQALGLPGADGKAGRRSYTVTVNPSRRTNQPRKTSNRPPTKFERQLLEALATDPGRIWQPRELIRLFPETFGSRSQPSIHMSGHSAWGKGLLVRRKRLERVGYQISELGLQVLAEHSQKTRQQ